MPVIVDPSELDPYQARFIAQTVNFLTTSDPGGYTFNRVCFQSEDSDWLYSVEQCLGICTKCKEHFDEQQKTLTRVRDMIIKTLEYLEIWYQRDRLVDLSVIRSLFRAMMKLTDYKMLKCKEVELADTVRTSLSDYHRLATRDFDESDRIVKGSFPEPQYPEAHLIDNTAELLKRLYYAMLRMDLPNYHLHDVDYLVQVVQNIANKTTLYSLQRSGFYHDGSFLVNENKASPMQLCALFLEELKLIRDSVKGISQAWEPLARFAVSAEFDDSSRNHHLFLLLIIDGDCMAGFISGLVKLAAEQPDDRKIISWLDAIIRLIKEAVGDDVDGNFRFTATLPLHENKDFRVTPSICCWLECLVRNTGDEGDDSNPIIYPPERHFKRFFSILAPTGWAESDVLKEFEAERKPGICECEFVTESNYQTKDIPETAEQRSSRLLLGLPRDILHKIFTILATEDYFSLYALSWTCRALRHESKEFMNKYPWQLLREKKCNRNRNICKACKNSDRRNYIDNLILNIMFESIYRNRYLPLIKWHFE